MRKFTMNYFLHAITCVFIGFAAFLVFMAILGLLLYAMTQPARADVGDVWVSPYSFTQHYQFSTYSDGEDWGWVNGKWRDEGRIKFKNSHPSLGIEYLDSENTSVAAGVYRDSYGGTSVYFARHWRYAYGLGATMGVLAGPSYPYEFVPFLGPEITVQVMSVKASLAYLPNFGTKNMPSLAVLQVAVKVW